MPPTIPTVVTPKRFGPPLGMYSHGMVAPGGEIVVVAGQVGVGEGGAVAVRDAGAPTKQTLHDLRTIVEAARRTMGHVRRPQNLLSHSHGTPRLICMRAA